MVLPVPPVVSMVPAVVLLGLLPSHALLLPQLLLGRGSLVILRAVFAVFAVLFHLLLLLFGENLSSDTDARFAGPGGALHSAGAGSSRDGQGGHLDFTGGQGEQGEY